MRAESIRDQLDQTIDSDEEVTLILNWRNLPPRPDLSRINDAADRWRALRDFYEGAKAPTLDAIEKSSGVSVDRLEGSGQAIVAAPASTLRRLLDDPQSPLRTPSIDIELDQPHFARAN